ncbi:signal peptidase I [Marinicella sp. W31]|uniref:signal peptidase I n=1 Tax=Marinicella sp. W31 TaxID=3023713 RepID=UPI003756EC53
MDTVQKWKPNLIISGILALLTTLFAFFYVNKAKWFIVYLLLIIPVALTYWYFDLNLRYVYVLSCFIHVLFIAHRYDVSQQRHNYSRWWGITTSVIISILLVFLFRLFLYEPFRIPASSMNPSIKIGDHILVNKQGFGTYTTFGFNLHKAKPSESVQLKRGSLYVFFTPGKKQDTIFIKRLIGLPGDDISIQEDRIKLNGQYLPQNIVSENDTSIIMDEYSDNTSYQIQLMKNMPPIMSRMNNLTIPDDHYFFIGDNRLNSLDSRRMGPIPADHLIGEVTYVFKKND